MSGPSRTRSPQRRYPPFWERAVPFFLFLIGLAMMILIVVSLAVLLGWF